MILKKQDNIKRHYLISRVNYKSIANKTAGISKTIDTRLMEQNTEYRNTTDLQI